MLSFEENYIPDETERLIFLLEQYAPFLKKHATIATLQHRELILKLLKDKTEHTELLNNIKTIFVTEDKKPKQLMLTNNIDSKLGPNRTAEYLGLHADISFMVTQHLSKK